MKQPSIWAGALALAILSAGSAWAQDALPAPSPIEKKLAERAAHVTEVTLDKAMLGFAAKFMDNKGGDKEEKAAAEMIQNLKGVYVREYEFDKEDEYSAVELEGLRAYIQGTEWSPMVHERSRGKKEGTDVYVKLINGQLQGLFVLDAEPKQLSLVLILGPLDMEKIGKLGGNFGIPKSAIKAAQKEVGK